MPDNRPIPPPPGKQGFSASPSDEAPKRERRKQEGVPKQFATGTHLVGDLQTGQILPGEAGSPDRTVHSVTRQRGKVRLATTSGNQPPIVETFPENYRFTPKG